MDRFQGQAGWFAERTTTMPLPDTPLISDQQPFARSANRIIACGSAHSIAKQLARRHLSWEPRLELVGFRSEGSLRGPSRCGLHSLPRQVRQSGTGTAIEDAISQLAYALKRFCIPVGIENLIFSSPPLDGETPKNFLTFGIVKWRIDRCRLLPRYAVSIRVDTPRHLALCRCHSANCLARRQQLGFEPLEYRLVLSSITPLPDVTEDLSGEFMITRVVHRGSEPMMEEQPSTTVPFQMKTIGDIVAPPADELPPIEGELGPSGEGGEFAPFGSAIGLNFQSANRNVAGFIPPDTMGAVGPDHIVTLINGRYRTFDKLDGGQLESLSLDGFWLAAGVNPTNFAFDPRVLYDSEVGRWYATSLDNPRQNNRFLFAVSDTADPTDGWTGFAVDSDSSNGRWADFPQMSFDDDGVYIGANMFDIDGGSVLSTQRSTLVLPKSGLLANPPSIAGRTLVEDHISISGFAAQGVVYGSEGAGLPSVFVSGDGSSMLLSQLVGPISSPSFASFTTVGLTSVSGPPLAEQPNDTGITGLDTGGTRVRSKVDFHNAAYWVVQGGSARQQQRRTAVC